MSDAAVDALVETFRAETDRSPDGLWASPGRVNLIGEHTDYNDGFVMPFALAQQVAVAAAPRDDDRWRVRSVNNGETVELRPVGAATRD